MVFELDEGSTVVIVAPTGSGSDSGIIGMIMISITIIYGNIIIVNNSINQTSTRLGKENISNLGTDIGAVLGLVLGIESGIDLGARIGAALGPALRSGLGLRLGSLLGIGFVTSIIEKLNRLEDGGCAGGDAGT